MTCFEKGANPVEHREWIIPHLIKLYHDHGNSFVAAPNAGHQHRGRHKVVLSGDEECETGDIALILNEQIFTKVGSVFRR